MPDSPIRPSIKVGDEEVDIKQKSLFARLKKLFSSGEIVRNVGGKKLKIKDTSDLMYATDRNSLRDRFNRVRSTSYNAYTRDFSLAYQAARIDLFRDYYTMDMDPILSSALDVYADESLTKNEMGKILVVHAEDDNIKGILTNLYYDILNIEHNLWSWTRNMSKYGDFYMRLYISPEYGVYQVEPISAYNVERLENTDPLNKNYVKFQIRPTDTSQVETLESFECAHFRLLSDSNFLPYGKCVSGTTTISCKDGPKLIKDINNGDVVYSFDYNKKEVIPVKVLNKIMSGIKKTYEIKTAHRKIYATYEHPIMVKDGTYKQVKDLTLDDWLILPTIKNEKKLDYPKLVVEENENFKIWENKHHIEKIRSIKECEKEEVYDIQVDNNLHNFIADGLVIHNSMIEGARRVWKQLSLLEDAMLINRIMRAPERRIFKVDIGNIPPQDVDSYMEKLITKMKKVPYVDPQTGDYNLRFNLQNMVEDYYLPVRGSDSGTSIETLSGIEWTGIDDIEYVRNKMMAALKIPKAFLGYEEELCIRKNTKIPLLDGKIKSVEELIKDYKNGIKNYVYSIDEIEKNIVSGEIEWAGFTRKNAQLVRVWLDNEKYIDCTPDHNFMTRDGRWIEAQYLKENDSLMPLYRKKELMYGKSDYEMVYNPFTNIWEWTHKLIDNQLNGELIQPHIKNNTKFNINELIIRHHKDFNRFNNTPDNLQRISFKEHRKIHTECVNKTICSPKSIAYKKSAEFRNKKSKERIDYINSHPETIEFLKKNLAQYNFTNKELSILCENGWKKDDGKRKQKLIESNKKHKKTQKMCQVARIKRGYINPFPTFDDLIEYSIKNGYNTKLAKNHFGCGRRYINNLIYNNGYKSIDDFSKEYKNHKVKKVEWLQEKEDVCDIKVKTYHNFATDAGVVIHNSGKATLASEDVRFARTIQRIQKTIISELEKIGIVHLYSQGYRDETLVNFKIELTNPSTIFEKEKIEVWSNKTELAKSMMENKLFSKKWIYKNVFNLSTDDSEELLNQIVDDSKQVWRFKSIEEEGNDPAKPFQKINPNAASSPEGPIGGGGLPELGGGPVGGLPELGGGGPVGIGGAGGLPPLQEETTINKTKLLGDINYEKLRQMNLPIIKKNDDIEEGHGEHSEDYERPSQKGEHDSETHPFGEDPLGNLENNRKVRQTTKSIVPKWAKNSPLSLETLQKSIFIKNLKSYLKKSGSEKKELIKEKRDTGSMSILDERNIIG